MFDLMPGDVVSARTNDDNDIADVTLSCPAIANTIVGCSYCCQ